MPIDYPFEAELNAIRVKLYEETKDLTVEERVKRSNDKAQKLATEFGFKIGKPPANPCNRL